MTFDYRIYKTAGGWRKSCMDCNGDPHGHSVGWDGMGMGAQHMIESRSSCDECNGDGYFELTAKDIDDLECSVNGVNVLVNNIKGVLYASDADDVETIVTLDQLEEAIA